MPEDQESTKSTTEKIWLQEDQLLAREAAEAWKAATTIPDSRAAGNKDDKTFENGFLEGVEWAARRHRLDTLLENLGVLGREGIEAIAINEAIRMKDNRDAVPGFAVLYADIDGLKQVNDKYGHSVGDELIFNVGKFLRTIVLRQTDVVGHPHGDEFITLLPISGENLARTFLETGRIEPDGSAREGILPAIRTVVEKMRTQFKERYPDWPDNQMNGKMPGRVSVGWHYFTAEDFLARYDDYLQSAEEGKMFTRMLIREAEQSMYKEKKNSINKEAPPDVPPETPTPVPPTT